MKWLRWWACSHDLCIWKFRKVWVAKEELGTATHRFQSWLEGNDFYVMNTSCFFQDDVCIKPGWISIKPRCATLVVKKVKKQQPFQKSQVVLAPPPLPTKNSWTKVSWKPKKTEQNQLSHGDVVGFWFKRREKARLWFHHSRWGRFRINTSTRICTVYKYI